MNLVTAAQLAFRYSFVKRKTFPITTLLAIFGMAVGVASLVVAMAVLSGFESTLQKTVIDVSGHLMILKRGEGNQKEALNEIKPYLPGFQSAAPFIFLEAVLAGGGQVSGIGIEGVESESIHKVLNLKSRLRQGEFSFKGDSGAAGILVGKGLAEKFDLKVGDIVRIVIPIAKGLGSANFRPKMKKFVVNGVLAFGHHEFDNRYVMMDLEQAQLFSNLGKRITGYKIKMSDDLVAIDAGLKIVNKFGQDYFVRDWRDGNRNLFEAVALEKMIIFFVLLIIVIAACFNIAGTLFISVVRRFKDISVLKAMGANSRFILKIFSIQGLFLGFIGTTLGLLLGFGASFFFLYLQETYGVISSEVYKLDAIELNFRWFDILMIFFASMGICFLASLAPARRGARLKPVEGMRYD